MQMMLPERFNHFKDVNNLTADWEIVKLTIRPECRTENSITKAKKAIEVGLNDAAINYIWNLSIYDLQRKIITYGVDYFSSAINWDGKPLKNIEDLRNVKDYQIINGTFALGIIPPEAHFFLEQSRNIRNNFSTAHFPMGELDKIETFNFIKNCIKYVLTLDPPVPGLRIKDLVDYLTTERLAGPEEIKVIIEGQSSKMHGPILHSLFSKFIEQDCDLNLKHNIRVLAPALWTIVSDEVKSSIAAKFSSLKEVKNRDAANEALEFLKIVDGINFIPETFKDIIFKKHSQFLIDAHKGMHNFYREPGYAKDLASLGKDVPLSAIHTYTTAIFLSFIGNQYGISTAAQVYNKKMLSNLSQTGLRVLFSLLSSDFDIIRELSYSKPAQRLYRLMDLVKDKTMLPGQRELFEFVKSSKQNDIQEHFKTLYWKLLKE